MSLQLTLETTSIVEKHKSEALTSDLLDGPGKTVVFSDTSIISRPLNLDNRGFVSTERFIKYIPNERSLSLLAKYPNAFLLLVLVASRVRRTADPLGERQIGEAYIGDWESCGLTRQKYRTALKILCDKQILEIVVNKKLVAKSTTKATTNGTVVKLISSDIWDLNINTINHQINHQPTISQPSANHKQEREEREEGKEKKKKKNIKEKPSIEKKPYREKVLLSEGQYNILLGEHGELFLNTMLDELNTFKCVHGREYDSDYHTMMGAGWVLRKCKETEASKEKPKASTGIKEQVTKRFQNGNKYNDAECYINEDGVAFQRGMKHQQLKFKEYGFWDQFNNMLRNFGISDE